MLNLSTFNLSKCNISCKKNFLKCRTKIVLFGYFRAGTRKSCGFFKSAPSNFFKQNFAQNCLNWVLNLNWNYKKLMSDLKSASSNLLTCKVSSKNNRFLNLGPKIPYLGIFGMQFNKNYYQIFNQHTQICETIKFHLKRKKMNLGTKMLYQGFWLEC